MEMVARAALVREGSRTMAVIIAIQIFCGIVFAVDLGYELYIELFHESGIGFSVTHLGFEATAFILLFSGYVLAHRHLRRLRSISSETSRKLDSLRGQFDNIIAAHFTGWGLSPAECDVALLSLRGLRIGDIARMRGVREGTVKAQLSSVFRKSGIGTRAEFLAYFMDEFLDFGAVSGEGGRDGTSR